MLNGSNYEKAIQIVKQLNAKQVYVYAMWQEPWLTFLTSLQYTDESPQIVESTRLIDHCREMGVTSEGCIVGRRFSWIKEVTVAPWFQGSLFKVNPHIKVTPHIKVNPYIKVNSHITHPRFSNG